MEREIRADAVMILRDMAEHGLILWGKPERNLPFNVVSEDGHLIAGLVSHELPSAECCRQLIDLGVVQRRPNSSYSEISDGGRLLVGAHSAATN
jgi:hypothetical protein